jgi:hypothetical protein
LFALTIPNLCPALEIKPEIAGVCEPEGPVFVEVCGAEGPAVVAVCGAEGPAVVAVCGAEGPAVVAVCGAEGPAVVAEKKSKPFTFGGDFRFRVVGLSEIPTEVDRNNGTKITDSQFLRFRTRVWGQYRFDKNNSFRLQIANEFRLYDQGRVNHTNPWPFPDQFMFDEMYFDSNNNFDGKLDLRIGRQFLMYGTGKIFLETSPLDGSRTMFSNAVKAKWSFNDKHWVDFLYFNNPAKDGLAIHSTNTPFVEWEENGGGFYGRNDENICFPYEYYYVYKDEACEGIDGRPVHLNTFGTRLLPEFGGHVGGNFEIATQTGSKGEQSIGGTMVDAFILWEFLSGDRHKPVFNAGYYYLSGDDAGSVDNEAWHPVMSRWSQYSDYLLYSYIDGAGGHGVGNWTNLNMLWCGFEYVPSPKTKVTLRFLNLKADEIDEAAHSGLGDSIGDLVTGRFKYKLASNWSGQLNYEWFRPGDYYVDDMSTGHFFRAEINYKF